MIMLQRKLTCKYTGTDEYMPKDVQRDKKMAVIGFEVQKREVSYNGKRRIEDDLFFLVVNNKGHVTRLASFCCSVMVDDTEDRTRAALAQGVGSVAELSSMLLCSSEGGMVTVNVNNNK